MPVQLSESLSTPAPVTDHNLLLAGVNFLEPPLAVLRKQSEMRHSAALRKLLVDRHPSLEQRLPPVLMRPLIPARRSAGAADTEAKDKPANQLEEDYDRELRRREFGLKLATVWVQLHRARAQFLREMQRDSGGDRTTAVETGEAARKGGAAR